MAAESILILGESGQGKSTSLRNLNPEETFIIGTTSKPLPWRGWKKHYTKFDPKTNPDGNWYQTARAATISKIIKYVSTKMPHIKTIVVDDMQYAMTFEYMDRRKESGWGKFDDIGGDFTDLLRVGESLRDDLIIVYMGHSENTGDSMNPHWTLKTVGKLVSEKIIPEGMFTYVFYAMAIPGDGDRMDYKFLTNNDGAHVAKTSMGMFDSMLIDNDLAMILDTIHKYNLGE